METYPRQSDEMESKSTADRESSGDKSVSDELPLDKVFEILKNSRRRHTLAYLNANGGNTTLSDLAEHIAATENNVSVRALSSDQRKRVYVGLYQCHLPKMDDMNIVQFDKHRGTVELAAAASQFDLYIGDSDAFPWSRFYVGLSAAGIGLVTLSAVGILPPGITSTAVGLGVLAVLVVSSTIHVYVESEGNL